MPLKMKSPKEIADEMKAKAEHKHGLDKRANAQKRSEEVKTRSAEAAKRKRHTVEEMEEEETAKEAAEIPLQKGQSLILDGKIQEVELRCPNPRCPSVFSVIRTVGEFNLARGVVRCGRCKSILHRIA